MIKKLSLFFVLVLLVSCSSKPRTASYNRQYEHLEGVCYQSCSSVCDSDYFLIIFVDARHLDYSHTQNFFRTFTKNPLDGSKEGLVGHAWIYMEGLDKNGEREWLEGGHSGEFGVIRPRYMEGVSLYAEQGDPNPIRYLWESLEDGCFQEGAGGHIPTFAAKFSLTEEQYRSIHSFIQPISYPYKEYSLTKRQCVSFVAQVAALADIFLETDVLLPIQPVIHIGGEPSLLWSDSHYSVITFSSPDILEKSLIEKVQLGEAEFPKKVFKSLQKKGLRSKSLGEQVKYFPYRHHRHLQFN